ncbi:hypothetical protein [Albibacillus kandeliae]|uniref:hypothetical protein n=1 Tax=Albibacillus kandeliae TaxID=2174228 RepID=UPI000D68D7B0|nr:hypothetical protein [Albibacillus kandeliae]
MDSHSRIVGFFKVLLPLAALAILATLFLISRGVNFEATIPFAEDEVADRLRDQQITGPFFSGTTAEGEEIVFSAAVARPGGPDKPAEANEVNAKLTTSRGELITLDSDLASVDMDGKAATFSGNVLFQSSTGIEVRTDQLYTVLDGIQGNSPGTITGTGPFGDITAGQMEFGPNTEDGPLHVLFKDGVKLIYRPKETEK